MTYIGRRGEIGREVLGAGRMPLRPRPELGVRAAFEWGRPGLGADALALAMVADYLGDDQAALQLYRDVSDRIVARLPSRGWILGGEEIDRVIALALAREVA